MIRHCPTCGRALLPTYDPSYCGGCRLGQPACPLADNLAHFTSGAPEFLSRGARLKPSDELPVRATASVDPGSSSRSDTRPGLWAHIGAGLGAGRGQP